MLCLSDIGYFMKLIGGKMCRNFDIKPQSVTRKNSLNLHLLFLMDERFYQSYFFTWERLINNTIVSEGIWMVSATLSNMKRCFWTGKSCIDRKYAFKSLTSI